LDAPGRRLLDSLRGFPAAFWWLVGGVFVNRLGSFVIPFLSVYLTERRGLSMGRAGLVVSILGIGAVAASLAGGLLADRWGRRRTMLLSAGFSGILMMALGSVEPLPLVAALLLFLGFFADLFRPAMQAAVADLVAPERRIAAFGITYWAVNLGWSFAQPTAGLLTSWSWLALFVGDGLTTLLFGLLVWWRVPETRPPEAVRAAESSHPLAGLRLALSDRDYRPFLIFQLLFVLVLWQSAVAQPLDLMAGRGMSKALYGLVASLNPVLVVLLQPSIVAAVARRDPARVMAASALATGLGYGLFAVGTSPWLYAGGILLYTLGEIGNIAVAPAVVAALAPVAHRGVYQGAWTMTWGAAHLLAPALGGFGLQRLGSAGFWSACLALGVAVALGQLATGPRLRARLGAGGLRGEAA